MPRRITIRGQAAYYNGTQFVFAVAELFKLTNEEADDLISSAWNSRTPTDVFMQTQNTGSSKLARANVPSLIVEDDYVFWRIANHIKNTALAVKPDDELEAVLTQVRSHMNPSVSEDDYTNAVDRLSGLHTEMQIHADRLRNTMMNTGQAEGRPDFVVRLVDTATNPYISLVIADLVAFTDGRDTTDYPNFAVRLPAETEITLRRLPIGSALLIASLYAVNTAIRDWNSQAQVLFEEMARRAGIICPEFLTYDFNRWPNLIIDYCIRTLRADRNEVYVHHFAQGGALAQYGRLRYSMRHPQIELPNTIARPPIYEIMLRVLVSSLNDYTTDANGPMPTMADYLGEYRNSIQPYVVWMHENGNQAPEGPPRPDHGPDRDYSIRTTGR